MSILVVTAHPDDEAMFFSPFLTAHCSDDVFLLCLSTGNYEGLGDKRRMELYKSCAYYNIPGDRVRVMDHTDLQDGPDNTWDPSLIAQIVLDEYTTLQPSPTTIVTFDDGGVSGHPNHIATYYGVQYAAARICRNSSGGNESGISVKNREDIQVLVLETTSFVRKFLGAFDIALVYLGSLVGLFRSDYSNISLNLLVTIDAMIAHRSQFVWYRILFVLFSRYSYINTFHKMRDRWK
jgi:N-acetylglucosaminylphosphatidylinositol deacetylase